MNENIPVGPSAQDWAHAGLHVTKIAFPDEPERTIYELRKILVVNGVQHLQFIWLNQQQLRGVGIDHGL